MRPYSPTLCNRQSCPLLYIWKNAGLRHFLHFRPRSCFHLFYSLWLKHAVVSTKMLQKRIFVRVPYFFFDSSFLLCRWMIAKQRAAFAVRPCPMLLPPLRGWPRSRMDTRTHVTGTRCSAWPGNKDIPRCKICTSIFLSFFLWMCVCVYSAALKC